MKSQHVQLCHKRTDVVYVWWFRYILHVFYRHITHLALELHFLVNMAYEEPMNFGLF